MNLIDKNQWIDRISKISLGPRSSYLAMYSTWWDAVVIDPNLMMIPIDDHQVHRGDAVFEAMKAVHHKVYLFDEHLLRLERSMSQIDLTPPFSIKEIKQKVVETLNFTNDPACLIRLFVGRGPGSFTANPYDTIGSQLHIIITTLTPPAEDKVNSGVSLMTSKVKVKDSFMAQIKSCNYLANVLMKKEAVDHKVDFSIGVDSMGHFTEGSTENLIIVNQAGELCRPHFAGILSGTTMNRIFELTDLKTCEKSFNLDDLLSAKEAMMVGTTLDVLSVISIDGKKVGSGKPGPIAQALRKMILLDQISR